MTRQDDREAAERAAADQREAAERAAAAEKAAKAAAETKKHDPKRFGENVKLCGKGAPAGAVYQTPTQFLDADGQPLAPPVAKLHFDPANLDTSGL